MLAGELTATAQHRHTEAPRLVHLLRGDLDWIVMKALEKDRTRRYETANGLAMDLKRHLDNEPVVARPPSAIYKLRKAIRRNKTAFAAGTVVLAALAAGFAVAVGQYAAKNRAYKRERAEAEKARHEAAKSEQVVKFLEDMLGTTSPLVVPGVNASIVRQTLDWASERIRKELKNQPAVEAQLRMVLGKAYKQIHEDQKAEAMLRESLAIHRRLHGDRHPELVAPLLELSGVLWTTRRNAEAERLIREALALHHEFSKEKEPQLDEILNLLGVVLASQDKLAAAEQVLGETLALKRKLYGPTNSTVAVALINLGDVFKRQEKLPQAAAAEREALEMVTAALAALPETTNPGELLRLQAAAANNLSNTLEKQGLRSEAEAPRRQALEASKKLYGVGSQEAIGATRDLMNTLIRQRKLEEADRLTTAAAKELEAAELSLRASGAALRGRWKEAAAGYARLVELEPDNHEHYHALAPLLAQTGDWEGYRKNCQNEVARFRDTQIPHVAERMAKDCLILPNSGVDLKVVTAWTDLAVTAGKDSGVLPWFQHAKGLAEYRQGRFAEAIEWAQKALSRSQANRDLQATAVLAMSQHRLGHTDAARLSLAKAAELEANSPSLERGDIGNGWLDWIIAHALFREAQALIEDIPHSNGAAQKTNPALEEAHP
jgi:tetratricopeptide (TPR) repeat protein